MVALAPKGAERLAGGEMPGGRVDELVPGGAARSALGHARGASHNGGMPRAQPTISGYLADRRRPGCGVMIGRTGDGVAFELFWLSGRDRYSIEQTAATVDDTIAIGPALASRGEGRWAMSVRPPGWAVIGNGFDVEAAGADLAAGRGFEKTLRTRAGGAGASGDAQCLLAAVRMGDRPAGPFFIGSCTADPSGVDPGRAVCQETIEPGQGLVADACGDARGPGAGAMPVGIATEGDLDAQVLLTWKELDDERRVMVVGRAVGPVPAMVVEACR